jgi:hypothetical protein
MGVMCVVLAVFVWVNTRDREREKVFRGTPLSPKVYKETCRGFPLAHRVTLHEILRLDSSGSVVSRKEFAPGTAGYKKTLNLLLNLAFALLVSITLTLASERFVFSRLRRGPRSEAKEKPK